MVNCHLTTCILCSQRLQYWNCMLHELIIHIIFDHAIPSNFRKTFPWIFQGNFFYINRAICCWLHCAGRWYIYIPKRSMMNKSVLRVHYHCIQVKHKTIWTQEFLLPFYLHVHIPEAAMWRNNAVFKDKSGDCQASSYYESFWLLIGTKKWLM